MSLLQTLLFFAHLHARTHSHTHSHALCTSIGDRRKIKGRLIVASKSLLFDPDDWRHPVLRLAFRDTLLVQAVPTSSQRGGGSSGGDTSAMPVCSARAAV